MCSGHTCPSHRWIALSTGRRLLSESSGSCRVLEFSRTSTLAGLICPGGFIKQRVGFYTDCVSNPSVLSFLLPGYQPGSPQTGHDCLAVHAQCSTSAIPDCLAIQMQGLRPAWCSVVSMSGASPRTPFRHAWWLSPPRPAEFYSDHAPGHQLAAQLYCRSAVAVS